MKSWIKYVNDYKTYLKIERGLSLNSIENYAYDVQRLTNYLENQGIDISPLKIDEEMIQQFVYHMAAELNPRSRALMLGTVAVSNAQDNNASNANSMDVSFGG